MRSVTALLEVAPLTGVLLHEPPPKVLAFFPAHLPDGLEFGRGLEGFDRLLRSTQDTAVQHLDGAKRCSIVGAFRDLDETLSKRLGILKQRVSVYVPDASSVIGS